MRLIQQVTNLIAPPVCVLCGGDGQHGEEPWGLDLCRHCEAACPRAGAEPGPFAGSFCLFRYEDPVDLLIQRLKFQHELACARVLGTLFAQAWRAADRLLPQCLIPMPLHDSRYRERGFCQTSELACHIARRLRAPGGGALPVRRDLLRRLRATRAQSALSAAERVANLGGAFGCRAGRAPPRHVALLDDVLTTGNTARAAIAALRAGGVERVELWCCARAQRLDAAGGPDGPIC
jgi:ComF family protein